MKLSFSKTTNSYSKMCANFIFFYKSTRWPSYSQDSLKYNICAGEFLHYFNHDCQYSRSAALGAYATFVLIATQAFLLGTYLFCMYMYMFLFHSQKIALLQGRVGCMWGVHSAC